MQRRDPRNCRKVKPRSTEDGFTLVEMMVSLLIFGLLAAAGAALAMGGLVIALRASRPAR